MSEAVYVKGLTKAYGGKTAVNSLDLSVRSGTVFGLLGANAAVESLSGGERQRLFLVLALISQPELVFLDELTTGLDAKARRGVWKTLEYLKERGLTVFLTSHFMDEVEALCDEICILKKGTPVFRGTVEQAKAQCGCERFEDAYLQLSDEGADV